MDQKLQQKLLLESEIRMLEKQKRVLDTSIERSKKVLQEIESDDTKIPVLKSEINQLERQKQELEFSFAQLGVNYKQAHLQNTKIIEDLAKDKKELLEQVDKLKQQLELLTTTYNEAKKSVEEFRTLKLQDIEKEVTTSLATAKHLEKEALLKKQELDALHEANTQHKQKLDKKESELLQKENEQNEIDKQLKQKEVAVTYRLKETNDTLRNLESNIAIASDKLAKATIAKNEIDKQIAQQQAESQAQTQDAKQKLESANTFLLTLQGEKELLEKAKKDVEIREQKVREKEQEKEILLKDIEQLAAKQKHLSFLYTQQKTELDKTLLQNNDLIQQKTLQKDLLIQDIADLEKNKLILKDEIQIQKQEFEQKIALDTQTLLQKKTDIETKLATKATQLIILENTLASRQTKLEQDHENIDTQTKLIQEKLNDIQQLQLSLDQETIKATKRMENAQKEEQKAKTVTKALQIEIETLQAQKEELLNTIATNNAKLILEQEKIDKQKQLLSITAASLNNKNIMLKQKESEQHDEQIRLIDKRNTLERAIAEFRQKGVTI